MTKIFALNPNVKEGDEKPKELDAITVSSTTPQPTLYPVTLPISSIVAKKRCGPSRIVIVLLSLIAVSFLFYMIPHFYKRTHHVSNEVTVSGSTSWAQRLGRYGVEEEDTRIVPKLDSLNVPEKMSRMMDRSRAVIEDDRIIGNRDNEIITNDDEEVKQPANSIIPSRFEAMKAIATLLKIPGVQQVAIVQNNDKIPDNVVMRPEIAPDVPLVPQMEVKELELMNYRRAIREWLLRREMFRRRMLAELEREREEAAERKLSQIIMRLQLQQLQQQQQQQEQPEMEQLQSMLPALSFARMHIVQPPVMWMNGAQPSAETNQPVLSQLTMIPRIPPMHFYMIPKQQQQQPAIIPIKLMPPQNMNKEEAVIQPIGSNSEKLSTTPLQIRDDTINRLDLEQKKVAVPVVNQPIPITLDGTPDRDTIFKELRSRAQMQQMSQQPVLPAALIPPSVPNVVPPAQINSDEIFRELQHRALRMQIEQDRVLAEQREEKENVDTEVPVLMIGDTFPKQSLETVAEQTSEEISGATSAANIETTRMGNSSESLSTSSNFFDKGIHDSEITNFSHKGEEITLKNDDDKIDRQPSAEDDTFGDVPGVANEEVGLVIKPDETLPQINFIQELATSETPVPMDTSERNHSELFKSAVFQGKSGDRDGGDMLGTRIRLLETPQIQ
ncbi:unnamed protein product [Litomosoides sigmodontis]|uniref:Uncharacterized protein n=1 Tax=Litomosoides sigmodontis TaxID=42156 RepID=A0A3P6SEI5_LITSI|nr:unnamed protein product [Litomosoides sigmodontis]